MTKQELIKLAEKETDGKDLSLSYLIEDILTSKFEALAKVDTEGFIGEQFSEGESSIYELEDCFVIIVATDIKTLVFYSYDYIQGLKIATDKLYEHTYTTFNTFKNLKEKEKKNYDY